MATFSAIPVQLMLNVNVNVSLNLYSHPGKSVCTTNRSRCSLTCWHLGVYMVDVQRVTVNHCLNTGLHEVGLGPPSSDTYRSPSRNTRDVVRSNEHGLELLVERSSFARICCWLQVATASSLCQVYRLGCEIAGDGQFSSVQFFVSSRLVPAELLLVLDAQPDQ
jgi:hypothetical protein